MTQKPRNPNQPLRWWPGVLLTLGMLIAVVWVRWQGDWAFQKRNLDSAKIIIVTGMLLLVWWTFFSRAPGRLRLSITFGLLGLGLAGVSLFRIRGVSGDLLPIIEFRWGSSPLPPTAVASAGGVAVAPEFPDRRDFPQFLGPNRDGVLPGPKLATNWITQAPEVLWRQKVGAAWSGFVIVGKACLTQEQRGDEDCVVAYELLTGQQLWLHAEPAHYHTVIAGEGPRATPTVVSNRVFANSANGKLTCLDFSTGKELWSHDLIAASGGQLPQWGYACSPLVVEDRVIVHGGEGITRSLLAFRIDDGKLLWTAGTHGPSYASPMIASLAGALQVLSFNDGSVSAHDPGTGEIWWEKPWGNGNVVCATPVVTSTNRVLFSSGYGVGASLFAISHDRSNHLEAQLVWKSIRMKSKFAHLFAVDGNLFGLDDGILACVNLADGSLRWKEGRYGHGQGLLVGDLYLLMAESGELVLLHPTPEAPNELARLRIFASKTWNPIALSGNLLLVRNDQEAVCLRLRVVE